MTKKFINEYTETLDIKNFKLVAKKFKQLRLFNNNKYYLLNKKAFYKDIEMSDSYITFKYWEDRYDVLWITKID